jgi:hypothetical protein
MSVSIVVFYKGLIMDFSSKEDHLPEVPHAQCLKIAFQIMDLSTVTYLFLLKNQTVLGTFKTN